MIIKSLYKSLDILEYFTTECHEAGITEISDHFGLSKSNVCDIVHTFEQRGYLRQNPQTKKYRLGFQILKRYYAFDAADSAREIILPQLAAIADKAGERAYYGSIYEDMVIYLEQAEPKGDSWYTAKSSVGSAAPLFCTGIGKALLAYQEERYIDGIIAKGLKAYTQSTIVEAQALKYELAQIRARGYSIDRMEHEFGVACVGMPILDHNNKPIGAISITGPSLRFDEGKNELFADILKTHILEIRKQMCI